MAKKWIFTLCFLIFCSPLTFAQKTIDVEELKRMFYQKISVLDSSPKKIKFLPLQRFKLPKDSLHAYLTKIKQDYLSDATVYNQWQKATVFYEMGLIFYLLDIPDSSLLYLNRTIILLDKKQTPMAYIGAVIAAGYLCMEVGYRTRSNDYYLEALTVPEIRSDTQRYCRALTIVAENYLTLFEYNRSMEYCKKGYAAYMENKDFDGASYNLVLMYRNAFETEKDTSYLEYLHMANKLAEMSGKPGRIGNNLVNTGIAYYKEGMYETALDYLLRGWAKDKELSVYGDLYGSMWIAKTYAALDSIPQAYNYAQYTINGARELNAVSWIYRAYDALAACYEKMNRFDSATICLQEAIRLEKLSGKTPTPGYYRRLSDISAKTADYEASVRYLDTSYSLFTQIISETNEEELVKMRTQFDYDLQRERISELQLKQTLLNERNRRTRIMFITVSVILLLSVVFLYLLLNKNRKLRQSYVAIVRKNLELDHIVQMNRGIRERTAPKPGTIDNRNEERILQALMNLFEKQKIYKDPEISLSRLADMVETNTSYLSSIINARYGMNVKRLIHTYRIREARELFASGNYTNYSMEGIATELGYKSRSLFHQVFKEITGVTPAAYAANIQEAKKASPTILEQES